MKIQHKVMIKELLSGKYTGEYHEEKGGVQEDKTGRAVKGARTPEGVSERIEEPGKGEHALAAETPSKERDNTKKQITNSLDDVLLNYIMKRAK